MHAIADHSQLYREDPAFDCTVFSKQSIILGNSEIPALN